MDGVIIGGRRSAYSEVTGVRRKDAMTGENAREIHFRLVQTENGGKEASL